MTTLSPVHVPASMSSAPAFSGEHSSVRLNFFQTFLYNFGRYKKGVLLYLGGLQYGYHARLFTRVLQRASRASLRSTGNKAAARRLPLRARFSCPSLKDADNPEVVRLPPRPWLNVVPYRARV